MTENDKPGEVTHGVRLLRLVLIYGANASGKSNLLEAFDYFRKFWFMRHDDMDEATGTIPFLLAIGVQLEILHKQHTQLVCPFLGYPPCSVGEAVLLQEYAADDAVYTYVPERSVRHQVQPSRIESEQHCR